MVSSWMIARALDVFLTDATMKSRHFIFICMMGIGLTLWSADAERAEADSTAAQPGNFELTQNYPNPFNPTTTIRFSTPKATHVVIEMFDLLGAKVKTITDAEYAAGSYRIAVDAGDLPAGVYFYSMKADDFKSMKRMTVVK